MDLPFKPPVVPMEAEVATELPTSPEWSYEPKWDGFRATLWRSEDTLLLESRNGKPLLRYFPELEPEIRRLPPGTVADGEIVVITSGKLDFAALQNRVHPAASRIRRLSVDTPACVALFDLLAYRGDDLRSLPFSARRDTLVQLAGELGIHGLDSPPNSGASLLLSPNTTDLTVAKAWFTDLEAAGFEGIVAKALDRPYAEGRREMIKVKHRRTIDCVVGGYRLNRSGAGVASLLLGLYDERGELRFVGHCSSFSEHESRELLGVMRSLAGESDQPAGFGEHVRTPGGPSRWSSGRDLPWLPVKPELVIEVSYDRSTGGRIRHGTRFERWRPDKDPRQCKMDQLERPSSPGLRNAWDRGDSA